MHEHIVVDDPDGQLQKVVDMVVATNVPVTVVATNGDTVKLIPVPKPIRHWRGRPVYRAADVKYLYLDQPWLLFK